jgi:SAM-dependent MidA family methyltransferase
MNEQPLPLEAVIRRRIAVSGPMPVAQYMTLCLTDPQHGYYATRDPFGAQGDFVTAPEVSQMFGELIGLWAAATWKLMGSPENVRLVELGPGRGTMLADALRAVQIVPDFRKALVLHLVEISPVLRARQQLALDATGVPMYWHAALEEVPDGPVIILANEFIDALPVHQAVMCVDGWHERMVKLADNGGLQFSHSRDPIPLFEQMLPPRLRNAPIGAIFEWRADRIALEIGRRVVRSPGAALVIDYGHVQSAAGDTFQAVAKQARANPLQSPGMIDLTAHVDFQALANAAESLGARVHGPIEQGQFLRRLGIESRADGLRKASSPGQVGDIDSALKRLTSEAATGMGRLFKAIAFSNSKLGELPGFEIHPDEGASNASGSRAALLRT